MSEEETKPEADDTPGQGAPGSEDYANINDPTELPEDEEEEQDEE